MDWPDWFRAGRPMLSYATYVAATMKDRCLGDWTLAVQQHTRPIPYLNLTVHPVNLFRSAMLVGLQWDVLMSQRALAQLRCGLFTFGNKNGKKTRARVQACIFCNKRYSSIYSHAVCQCPTFDDDRAILRGLQVNCDNMFFLAALPTVDEYSAIASFARKLQSYNYLFWKSNKQA